MKIKAIAKLPRLTTIPDLGSGVYRELQAGEAVDVFDSCGKYLIHFGYAEEVIEAGSTGGTNGE